MQRLFSYFLVYLIIVSCNNELDNVKLPINTTLPLVDFDISNTQLLEWCGIENNITTNNDGIIQIESSNEIIFNDNTLSNLFNYADQRFVNIINVGISPNIDNIINIPPTTLNSSMQLNNNCKLDAGALQDGDLTFFINDNNYTVSNITCTVNNITINGEKLILRNGETINLQNASIKFTEDNSINYTIEGNIINYSTSDNIVEYGLLINNLQFKELSGFLGREEIKINNTYNISFDKQTQDFFSNCTYYIANPSLSFNINNAYNIPIILNIDKLAINDKSLELKKEIGSSKFYLQPNGTSTFTINNSSCVNDQEFSNLLSATIETSSIEFSIITNPTKEDMEDASYIAPQNNRINKQDIIVCEEQFNIPITGTFQDIIFNQTILMDLDINSDKTNYQYLKLAITSDNMIPMNIDFELFAIDYNGAEDNLFNNPVTIPASNGLSPNNPSFKKGIISAENPSIINLNTEQVNKLLNSNKLKFAFKGSMPKMVDNQYASVYANTNLRLKLIGNLKGEI